MSFIPFNNNFTRSVIERTHSHNSKCNIPSIDNKFGSIIKIQNVNVYLFQPNTKKNIYKVESKKKKTEEKELRQE